MGAGPVTSSAAVLRFSAEFATFLVAVAGAAIVLLRPRLLGVGRQARVALGAGFLAVATAAFLHGSLLFEAGDVPVIIVRSAGIVLLAVGTLGWGDDRATRRVVWGALVLLAMAEVAAGAGLTSAVADGARALGALGLGAVLVSSARRSIPARVAVSTAAALLLVVLAVSVALSAVISNNVQKDALRQADARARTEADEVGSSAEPAAVTSAALVGSILQSRLLGLLQALAVQGGPSPDLDAALDNLVANNLLPREPVLYVTASRAVVSTRRLTPVDAEVVAGSEAVTEAMANKGQSGTVAVVGRQAVALGAQAVIAAVPEGIQAIGVVVVGIPVDDAYLNVRARNDPTVSLAVVAREGRLAGFGPHLPAAGVQAVGRAALAASSGEASSVAGGSFLAARAVRARDGTPVVAVVASTPTTAVDNTRASLFRTLFVVALVTALAAFLAALLVGERIGVGLRRLTDAAEGVRRGDFATRVTVASKDELGVLGSTLNTMAGSIETLTTELRQNRDEEARLRGRLEAVVGGMGEAVVAVDERGRVTTFNGAAEDLFGVAAAAAEGRPAADVVQVVAEDGTDLTPRLSRSMGERWGAAAVVRRADGVAVPVALSAGSLGGPSGDGGGVWVLRDMRAEREAERTKADLLANISHELRTPLVPIKGYAMMLRRGTLPPADAEAALGAITDAADHLERVVGRLLQVASGAAVEDEPVRRAPTDVRPLVDSVVRRWKAREGRRHPITRRVARGLPELTADRRSLEESLDELMDNAVKFSPEGSRILVAARLSEDGDGP
ncbi:MAG: histidine kinase dimerization/phospho-acceptor domain-containing protein, partial [Acidimicrobiales bacterium]